jgi:hypothetical protein
MRGEEAAAFYLILTFSPISMLDDIRAGFINSHLDGVNVPGLETAIFGCLPDEFADAIQTLELG